MKTLGLIGGTSWYSTVDYYRLINTQVGERLGGLNSAKLILYSVNFEEFRPIADTQAWIVILSKFGEIAQRLEAAGAEAILFCANTPHLVAPQVQRKIKIPLIHIAEETARVVAETNIKRVALLGTKFTMEQAFFRDHLAAKGLEVMTPAPEDRQWVHDSILDEMGKGIFTDQLRQRYLELIARLKNSGAEGVIFGCTEIPMLLKSCDCRTLTFDTTVIHATAAVNFALSD
jgi:aspartate racemase